MDPGSIDFHDTIEPRVGVLQTVAGPSGQSRMVYQHRVPYLESGKASRAVRPSQLRSSNVFQVSSR